MWKRALGGLAGMAVFVGVILLARHQGVSGSTAEHWQGLITTAAAVAGVGYFLWRRSRR